MMVTTKLNLSMTEPQVRQIYAKQGDTGRVLDISLDQTPEDGTLRILRPDGVEVTSEAVTGGEVESGGTFESLTEADVTELSVGIEPVQDLSHGDPSPSNICPITGHDEVEVTRTGKNLYSRENGAYNVPVYGTDGSSASYPDVNAVWIPVKPNTLYTVASARTESSNFYVRWINCTADKEFISRPLGTVNSNQLPLSSRTPANCYWVEVAVNQYPTSQISRNDWELSVVEGASTAYEPYQGSTYTTSLGQTVYGGTLDMVTGQLVVDKAMVDLGSLTWLLNSSLNGKPAFYVRLNDAKTVSASSVADMTTSCYSVISADNLYLQKDNTGIIALNGQNYLRVRDTRYSTASDYKSGITGQQLVYELATPLTYTLTPQQIKTLVGTNNVWASSGDIVSIKFTYGGLLSELPSEATEIVGKCYCDVEQNGVSSMPFTLNIKKNERQ